MARIRGRPAIRLAVLVTALLAVAATSVSLVIAEDDEEWLEDQNVGGEAELEGPSTGNPDLSRERYEAALADLESERIRIEEAEQAFSADLSSTPDTARDYLVSFGSTSLSRVVLEGIAVVGIELTSLHTWIGPDDAVDPIYGEHWADEMGWDGTNADQASAYLEDYSREFLEGSIEDEIEIAGDELEEEGLDASGAAAAPGTSAAIADLTARMRLIRAGVPVYGLRCACTPRSIVRLAEETPVTVLIVEPADDPHQFPLPPSDTFRDLVIASEGRYGYGW